MAEKAIPLESQRLISLGRAVVESRRGGGTQRTVLDADWTAVLAGVPEDRRQAAAQEVPASAGATGRRDTAGAAEAGGASAVQAWMQKCASLELKLQTEGARYAELEGSFRREQESHAQALESLALQQRKIKELQEGRAKLLEDLTRVEGQLRRQINETEQLQLKYDKVKSTRQVVGDQVTQQTEEINALQAENERLRAQVEETLRQRDRQTAAAQAEATEAEGRTAEAVLGQLWKRMHAEVAPVFLETHVPTVQTFERASDALVEFVRVFATLEKYVHHMLRDLRQVGEEDDKLARFYMILTKNPGLTDTLRDYLVTGRGRGNFVNLLRAVQAWARAFGSGLYKVIVQSPALVAEQLNYRNWPVKGGMLASEEANLGKYFKETAQRTIPEMLGTRFRKQAGDMAYEDYNTLMRQQR